MSWFKWYRKWRCGHWENWWCESTKSMIWLKNKHGTRPPGCFGTPKCEDW